MCSGIGLEGSISTRVLSGLWAPPVETATLAPFPSNDRTSQTAHAALLQPNPVIDDTLGRANTDLKDARDTKDRRRVQNLHVKAQKVLERIDISKSIDRDQIFAFYRQQKKWGLGDEAQLSYDKADELMRD